MIHNKKGRSDVIGLDQNCALGCEGDCWEDCAIDCFTGCGGYCENDCVSCAGSGTCSAICGFDMREGTWVDQCYIDGSSIWTTKAE
jgi:hypothetical protein